MISYRKRIGRATNMELHPRLRMRRNVPSMESKRKGKGTKPNPKEILVRRARRKTCPKSSAFTLMNSGTMP